MKRKKKLQKKNKLFILSYLEDKVYSADIFCKKNGEYTRIKSNDNSYSNNDFKKNKKNKNKNKKHQIRIILLPIITIFLIISIYILILHKNYAKKDENILPSKIDIDKTIKSNKKRIGVVGISNGQNVGNLLVKFSMFNLLKEYGFDPIILSKTRQNNNIYFLEKTVKLKVINNSFSELNEDDYDILMVNSDQTWSFSDRKTFYDYALLKFAEKWNVPKFIYGACMGNDRWFLHNEENRMARKLLKNFTGISFREIETVRIVERYLDLKSEFVLDPTFLLNINYYLEIIKNYKRDFNFNEKYIMVYQLDKNEIINHFIKEVSNKLQYKIYNATINDEYYIENFLFGINISQGIITDSYHGTVFSIIFNKPFISYVNVNRGKSRFDSLKETFNLRDRIITPKVNEKADVNLLLEPLNINQTLLNELKINSINFLKKNLGIF